MLPGDYQIMWSDEAGARFTVARDGRVTSGDVRLLGGAKIGERVGGFMRATVEGAVVRAKRRELFLGTDEEEGSGADRNPRYRTAGQSHRT